MKKLWVFAVGVILFAGCQKSDDAASVISVYTGNQSTYYLQQASAYTISGTVTFKERKDGTTDILIALTGITDDDQHPVHLHMGDISTNQATIAALLVPVAGKNGQSKSNLAQLADGTFVTYGDLVRLDASVNVHLASVGPSANIILAAGNVGNAVTKASTGRIGICRSSFF
jgi:hypothetical protein